MDADALLDGLTVAQRAAVASDATPLCVLAGAGSGKTRVLTHRIAYRVAHGHAEADRVLALTFTRKAAGELRNRLGRLGVAPVAAGTFHAIAYAQLRRAAADRGQRPPVLVERKSRILGPRVADRRSRLAAEAEISWAKARGLDPSSYAEAAATAGRRPAVSIGTIAELFAHYEGQKRRRGVVDLDDLIVRCADLLEHDHSFAQATRWRWRHFFVDEYQDLNPALERLLQAWLGGRHDLFVVGDPHQSIYGWNGAEPSLLNEFAARYPTATVIELDDNFRSSPEILAAAGAVLGHQVQPAAVRDPGPLPTVTVYDDEEAEAAGIARRLRDGHLPGAPWAHQAVLARTNTQLDVIAAALDEARVPYRHRSKREHPAHHLLATVSDDVPARHLLADLRALPDPSAGRALAEYLELDPSGTAGGFAAWLRSEAVPEEPLEGDGVILSTFHRAKGLEWPAVFVAGLEDGLVPFAAATGRAALAEERRLLYVAMTRAERQLHCSWARRRATAPRSPSPWLAPVQRVLASLASERDPVDPRPRLRLLRARFVAPRPDQVLLEDLTRWRASAARASGVTPSVILRDDALAAVAAARPRSFEELALLPGFGPIVARRWAPFVLDVVSRHAPAV